MRTILVLMALIGCACAAEPWSPASDLIDPHELTAVNDTPLFRITATIAGDRLDGSAVVTWTNTYGEALSDLVFQAFANGEHFHGASFVMDTVTIAGASAQIEAHADNLGVRVIPASPIADQARVEMRLTWHVQRSSSGGLHGLLAERGDVTVWHAWYPELAPRQDGRWLVDPVADLGDPVRAKAHHIVAELTLADGGPIVSSGTVVAERDDDGENRTITIAAAYQRNLTLVIGEEWSVSERLVGKTMVRAWMRPGHDMVGERVLSIAAAAVGHMSEILPPYPYRELEVVDYQLGESVGGVECSGLVLIGSSVMESFTDPAVMLPPESLPAYMLEAVICHEVAHQWWYGAVGNDAVAEPWLDESLTQWTTNWLLEQQFGAAVRRTAWQLDLMTAMSARTPDGFTSANRPIYEFTGAGEIGANVYGRGAISYAWLRQTVGDQAFFALLKEWATTQRFRMADAAHWQALMRQRLGAEVTDDFFARWIGGKGLTLKQVVEAANAAARGTVKP